MACHLAREWNCSTKSVTRTLQQMQADGLPLEYDRSKRYWYYTRPVGELPAGLVSDIDRRALLFALRATGSLEGLPIGPAIQRLYEKLLATLPPERANAFSKALRHVHFTGPRPPEVKRSVWECILLSLEASTTMHIHYTDGGFGSSTHRSIDPYALIMRERRWILVAHCHLRQQILTFALHRITQAECTDEEFTLPEKQVADYLASGYGGYPSSADRQTIRLRIGLDAPPYVKERAWADGETRTTDASGQLIISFRTSSVWAVVRDVLAEGEHVELLEPTDARAGIQRIGARLAQAHNPHE